MLFIRLISLILMLVDTTMSSYHTVFLQDACKCSAIEYWTCEPASLDRHLFKSGYIALSRDPNFHRVFYCVLTITAPHDMRVLIHINQLDIPMPRKGCKNGMLKIVDASDNLRYPTQPLVACDSQTGQFVSASNTVNISYHQTRSILRLQKSFNLTFTFFKNEHDGVCGEDMFHCADRKCIARSLECDGVSNCADGSDESLSYHVCGKLSANSDPRVGIAVGAAIAVGLTFTFTLVIIYRFKCSRKRSSNCPDETLVIANRDQRTTRISVHIDLPNSLLSSSSPANSRGTASPVLSRSNGHMTRSRDVIEHDDTEPPPSYESLFPSS